jgi:hypothetical protein
MKYWTINVRPHSTNSLHHLVLWWYLRPSDLFPSMQKNSGIPQDVPRGKVNILGGHSIGHSKHSNSYMYMCPIPNCCRDRAVSLCSSLDLAPNTVLPSGIWIGLKRQLAVVTVDSDTVRLLWKMPHTFTNAEYADTLSSHELQSTLKLTGSIFENVLYWVNCTHFVTWTINTSIRNST